jgi:TetR/AcrR family transcriptional regulator
MRSAAKQVGKSSTRNSAKRAAASRTRAQAWNATIVDRGEETRRKRRAVIVEAARAFGHRGFHNVSLDEVAVALNVSKPTLYNYVKSKHELLYECYNLALDFGDEVMRDVMAQDGTGLARLSTFIKRYILMLTEQFGPAAVFYEFYSMRPSDREKIQRRRRGFDKLFRKLVSDGIADGSIAPCDPKLAVFWFMGAVSGITRWFDPKGELSGEEIADAFIAFLKSGIGAAGAKDGPAARR